MRSENTLQMSCNLFKIGIVRRVVESWLLLDGREETDWERRGGKREKNESEGSQVKEETSWLRFSRDKRMKEVRRMLQSSSLNVLSFPQGDRLGELSIVRVK